MKITGEFSHSIITELNYKVTKSSESIMIDQIDKLEYVQESTQGRIGIHNDCSGCIIKIITDLKSVVEETPYRSLELSVDFHFDLVVKDDNGEKVEITEANNREVVEEIHKQTETVFVLICRQQLREIIRQITSVDYQLPIITESIEMPFNNGSF